jgi:hypothetical protein
LWERINEGVTTVFRASQRREAEGKPSDTRQGTSAWADERSSGAGDGWACMLRWLRHADWHEYGRRVRPHVGNGLGHGHGEVGTTAERHDAVHECMRRERRRNARARESVECWPEVREDLTYSVRMSMKRKQRGWVHGADRLGHERACARGSWADAASHGSVQVGHVCETRESGFDRGAWLATR